MCNSQACIYCGTVPFVAEGGFHTECINVGYCFLPGPFTLIVFAQMVSTLKGNKAHVFSRLFSSSPDGVYYFFLPVCFRDPALRRFQDLTHFAISCCGGVWDTSRPHCFSLFFYIVNTHMMSLHKHIWLVVSSFWESGHIWSVLSEYVKREVKWGPTAP